MSEMQYGLNSTLADMEKHPLGKEFVKLILIGLQYAGINNGTSEEDTAIYFENVVKQKTLEEIVVVLSANGSFINSDGIMKLVERMNEEEKKC